MSSMRARLLTGTSALLVAIATCGAAAATAAAPTATNGGASQIAPTTAMLNGTVVVTDTAPDDSVWYFQYGTTTNYGHHTTYNVTGPESQAVHVPISGLTPSTTYHFRLVVGQNINYSPEYAISTDGSFTTPANGGSPTVYGRANLKSRRLRTQSGFVSIPFGCSGAAGAQCRGAVLIATTGKLGKSTQAKMYGCAGGSFSTVAGKPVTLSARLSRSCRALLRQSPHHRLHAVLRATYSTHQSRLQARITLLG